MIYAFAIVLDHTKCLTGRWIAGSNAGGQISHRTFYINPQIKINVPSKIFSIFWETIITTNFIQIIESYKRTNSLYTLRNIANVFRFRFGWIYNVCCVWLSNSDFFVESQWMRFQLLTDSEKPTYPIGFMLFKVHM